MNLSSLLDIVKAMPSPLSTPDRVAVWNWDGFKQAIQAGRYVVLTDPAKKHPVTFMGLPVFVDETLTPGTVELRNGNKVFRTWKVT